MMGQTVQVLSQLADVSEKNEKYDLKQRLDT